MFYYLNGVVAHMAPFLAVIDCGGGGLNKKLLASHIFNNPHHQQHPVPSAKGEAGQALYPPECP